MVLLGFMLPTAFLSMWISNTASTAMMIPILEAVLIELGPQHRHMMMLAIAYAANVGGTGTLIGTPPNLVMFEFISKFPGQPIEFGSWMVFCVPLLAINLVLSWLWLQMLFLPLPCRRRSNKVEDSENRTGTEDAEHASNTAVEQSTPTRRAAGGEVRALLLQRYAELGPMSSHEYSVLGLFLLLVGLWLTRSPGFVPGWADLLPPGISDATPAILVAVIMFAVPAGSDGKPLLNWALVQQKLAWGVIILLGGGFALAEGAERSCLTAWVGQQLARLGGLPPEILRYTIQGYILVLHCLYRLLFWSYTFILILHV